MNKSIIFEALKKLLISNFEIDAASISPEKRLDDDLGLDSLDMVDIILYLKDYVSEKVDPGLFKNAHTVQDIINLIEPYWKHDL